MYICTYIYIPKYIFLYPHLVGLCWFYIHPHVCCLRLQKPAHLFIIAFLHLKKSSKRTVCYGTDGPFCLAHFV